MRLAVTLVMFAALAGCGARTVREQTMDWVLVETKDLRIRTDIKRERAVKLAKQYQQIRDALATSEFPCGFERSNSRMEFVILKRQSEIDALGTRRQAGISTSAPSTLLPAKSQLVMSDRYAGKSNQLFLHELTHGLTAICYPTAPVWFAEGLAGFYETAKREDGKLVIGIPPYVFERMQGVEPEYDIYPVPYRGIEAFVLPVRVAPKFETLRSMSPGAFYVWKERYTNVDLRTRTAHYAGSWLAVHLLEHGDQELRDSYIAYLEAIRRGDEPSAAWDNSLAAFDVAARYEAYRTAEYKIRMTEIDVPSVGEPTVRTMSQTEAATFRAGLWHWRLEDEAVQAKALIDLARELDPQNAAGDLYRAAFMFERDGQTEQAMNDALARHPNDTDVLAVYVRWRTLKLDLSDEQALALQGPLTRLRDQASTAFHFEQLGRYEIAVGSPENAISWLKKAVEFDANRWETWALAGGAYEDLGRIDFAIRAYTTAVSLTWHASADIRASLMKRLEELKAQQIDAGAPR